MTSFLQVIGFFLFDVKLVFIIAEKFRLLSVGFRGNFVV